VTSYLYIHIALLYIFAGNSSESNLLDIGLLFIISIIYRPLAFRNIWISRWLVWILAYIYIHILNVEPLSLNSIHISWSIPSFPETLLG